MFKGDFPGKFVFLEIKFSNRSRKPVEVETALDIFPISM